MTAVVNTRGYNLHPAQVAEVTRLVIDLLSNLGVMPNRMGGSAKVGTVQLIAGTADITVNDIDPTSYVFLSRALVAGAVGDLSYSLPDATTLRITSANAGDTSDISYLIVKGYDNSGGVVPV